MSAECKCTGGKPAVCATCEATGSVTVDPVTGDVSENCGWKSDPFEDAVDFLCDGEVGPCNQGTSSGACGHIVPASCKSGRINYTYDDEGNVTGGSCTVSFSSNGSDTWSYKKCTQS
jgi:hypothetical protein